MACNKVRLKFDCMFEQAGGAFVFVEIAIQQRGAEINERIERIAPAGILKGIKRFERYAFRARLKRVKLLLIEQRQALMIDILDRIGVNRSLKGVFGLRKNRRIMPSPKEFRKQQRLIIVIIRMNRDIFQRRIKLFQRSCAVIPAHGLREFQVMHMSEQRIRDNPDQYITAHQP